MESYKEGVKAKLPALTLYLGLVVIFIVFAVICSMMGKNFLTLNNMFNIITQASIISIIAIGASLVIVTGGIDLSVGSIVGFVGIFGGLILKAGMPLIAMGILCIAAGAAFGLVNGCLVSYGKVPPFIVTLGAMQIARGLALLINGGQPISSFPKGLGSLMASKSADSTGAGDGSCLRHICICVLRSDYFCHGIYKVRQARLCRRRQYLRRQAFRNQCKQNRAYGICFKRHICSHWRHHAFVTPYICRPECRLWL